MIIQPSSFHGYDIIGDVHGCATALEALLQKMGYHQTNDGYKYLDEKNPRQVIFVGDLIDRGSEILQTLAIVKKMYDNGSAIVVMGNHEFNAIAYHTPVENGFLRQHNERSNKQIKETLDQFKNSPEAWAYYIEWFKTLPLFLEFDDFRVVHACWDAELIEQYWQQNNSNRLTKDILMRSQYRGEFIERFIERLTRGISLPLPDGMPIQGKDGFYRQSFRVHFWSESVKIYNDIVFQPDPLPHVYRERLITKIERNKLLYYATNEKPLFIGHYWLDGEPTLVSSNIACLDYSAVNKGKLVAYRFDTKNKTLHDDNFVFVDCEKF